MQSFNDESSDFEFVLYAKCIYMLQSVIHNYHTCSSFLPSFCSFFKKTIQYKNYFFFIMLKIGPTKNIVANPNNVSKIK